MSKSQKNYIKEPLVTETSPRLLYSKRSTNVFTQAELEGDGTWKATIVVTEMRTPVGKDEEMAVLTFATYGNTAEEAILSVSKHLYGELSRSNMTAFDSEVADVCTNSPKITTGEPANT